MNERSRWHPDKRGHFICLLCKHIRSRRIVNRWVAALPCGGQRPEDKTVMANQTLVRHINERRLLGVLRLSGPLSRAELARRLSLTRAAVTSMVDDLLLRKMV